MRATIIAILVAASLVGFLGWTVTCAIFDNAKLHECYGTCKAHGYIRSDIIHTGQCVCLEAVDAATLGGQ